MTPQEILDKSLVGQLASIEIEGTGEAENPKIFVRVPAPRKIRHLLMEYLPTFQALGKTEEEISVEDSLRQQDTLIDWAVEWLKFAEKYSWGLDSQDFLSDAAVLESVFAVREDIAISFGVGAALLAMSVIQGDDADKKKSDTTPDGTKPGAKALPEESDVVIAA